MNSPEPRRGADHNVMREVNRSLVLTLVKEGGPVSRASIARSTTLAKPTVSAIVDELIAEGLVDVIMLANRYSLLDPGALDTVLEPARRAGAAVVAVGVYATGLLATARPDPAATYEYRPAQAEMVDRARRIADVCEAHGVTLPAAALAFPRRHPAVAAVVVGMRSPREVDQNVDRWETTIPEGLWDDLTSAGLLPAAAAHPVG